MAHGIGHRQARDGAYVRMYVACGISHMQRSPWVDVVNNQIRAMSYQHLAERRRQMRVATERKIEEDEKKRKECLEGKLDAERRKREAEKNNQMHTTEILFEYSPSEYQRDLHETAKKEGSPSKENWDKMDGLVFTSKNMTNEIQLRSSNIS